MALTNRGMLDGGAGAVIAAWEVGSASGAGIGIDTGARSSSPVELIPVVSALIPRFSALPCPSLCLSLAR